MAEETAAKAEKKSNTLIIVLIAVIVLLLAAVGVGAWLFLSQEAEPVAEEVVEEVVLETVYLPLGTTGKPPYFMTNFPTEKSGTNYFMQIYIEAKVRDPEVEKALEKHMPLIQHRLSSLFLQQSMENMRTLDGREQLRLAVTDEVKKVLQDEIGQSNIDEILFTEFIAP